MDSPLLELVARASDATGTSVELRYRRPAEQPGPRMAEIWVNLSGLKFVSASAGAATEAAGKQLVAQDHGEEGLRLVIMATGNTNRVDPGVLATIRLQAGAGELSIDKRSPVFAPGDADENLQLGEPLTVTPQ